MTKRILYALSVLCVASLVSLACTPSPPPIEAVTAVSATKPFTYDAYSTLLAQHVNQEGLVDYAGLQNDRVVLDTFVDALGTLSRDEYTTWSTPEQLAFWINAYNAITLQAIIHHYPIEPGGMIKRNLYPTNSIRQIDGVWKKNTTRVLGTPITLNDIEHSVLRQQFDEPRIHVAIVCASMSCPPLRNEAFVAEKLEFQLIDQSARFVAHPRNLRFDTEKKTIELSAILDWFGEDFVGQYALDGRTGSEAAVLGYVHRYATEADQKILADPAYRVVYQDYDWTLNEQP